MKQYLELDTRLMLELLLVPDDLDSHNLSCLMIDTFKSLSKTTFAKEVKYLISISNMIFDHHIIITSLIIVAIIVLLVLAASYLF